MKQEWKLRIKVKCMMNYVWLDEGRDLDEWVIGRMNGSVRY